MRKLFNLFFLDFKLLTKNKSFYLKLMLFPSLLILILGSVFSNSDSKIEAFDVAFYSADSGESVSLGDILKDKVFKKGDLKDIIHLKEAESYNDGEKLVKEGKAAAFIYVPEHFTKAVMNNGKTNIDLIGDNNKTIDKNIVQAVLEGFTKSVKTMSAEQQEVIKHISSGGSVPKEKIEKMMNDLADNDGISADIPKAATNKNAVPVDSMQYYSIAMVVMFSIMTAFVLVHSIVDERQNNTLFRIKSTPTLNIQYVLGKLTGIIFAILMQMTAVILISWVVFRMNWGNLFDIFVITVVYAFAIGSIVLFWGFTAKDHVAVSSMASPVLYIFSFLGGSFISKNGLPDSLRVVQEIIPNGKAINSYLKVKQNIGLSGMYIDLLELIGIGLIFVFINIMVFNRKKVA
ncbi:MULTISPECIES: ABC transporter permease [Bacillus]|uniref:ABC transporter permease n=1 Tax=Bacillus TaxID=1386 RepID=UPI0006AF62C7|nr:MULTISPECIES: ABC transporter permease [Bacillus]AMQ69918.1 ABC transporter permease [Bacillus amyloliquefaciens UMAF6639]AWD86164.1 ABC transporter permease [Bacillus velezensis]AWM50389.1 ABC transporter permease [Bacillus amyloliquefaciens]KAF6692007.1 ABC transporter permease [Bacillus sp. EKM601B]KOS50519.1 ABC transporter permease [Bacillus amyloliquefaciens]